VTRLSIRLATGYPEYEAAVIVSLKVVEEETNGSRKFLQERAGTTDCVRSKLNDEVRSLKGTEAILHLLDLAKELISECMTQQLEDKRAQTQQHSTTGNISAETSSTTPQHPYYGRRWICVHRITNSDRRKSILREAQSHQLSGCLKHGYPGVIVIEGSLASSDEFVRWIKGNKSRFGGFGRKWGHRARGEIPFEEESGRRLPRTCDEMDDLSLLSALCSDCGLQDEFLQFVMQHKAGMKYSFMYYCYKLSYPRHLESSCPET
jgi:hypothetical protein